MKHFRLLFVFVVSLIIVSLCTSSVASADEENTLLEEEGFGEADTIDEDGVLPAEDGYAKRETAPAAPRAPTTDLDMSLADLLGILGNPSQDAAGKDAPANKKGRLFGTEPSASSPFPFPPLSFPQGDQNPFSSMFDMLLGGSRGGSSSKATKTKIRPYAAFSKTLSFAKNAEPADLKLDGNVTKALSFLLDSDISFILMEASYFNLTEAFLQGNLDPSVQEKRRTDALRAMLEIKENEQEAFDKVCQYLSRYHKVYDEFTMNALMGEGGFFKGLEAKAKDGEEEGLLDTSAFSPEVASGAFSGKSGGFAKVIQGVAENLKKHDGVFNDKKVRRALLSALDSVLNLLAKDTENVDEATRANIKLLKTAIGNLRGRKNAGLTKGKALKLMPLLNKWLGKGNFPPTEMLQQDLSQMFSQLFGGEDAFQNDLTNSDPTNKQNPFADFLKMFAQPLQNAEGMSPGNVAEGQEDTASLANYNLTNNLF